MQTINNSDRTIISILLQNFFKYDFRSKEAVLISMAIKHILSNKEGKAQTNLSWKTFKVKNKFNKKYRNAIPKR